MSDAIHVMSSPNQCLMKSNVHPLMLFSKTLVAKANRHKINIVSGRLGICYDVRVIEARMAVALGPSVGAVGREWDETKSLQRLVIFPDAPHSVQTDIL